VLFETVVALAKLSIKAVVEKYSDAIPLKVLVPALLSVAPEGILIVSPD
jgi:hypothetical protein